MKHELSGQIPIEFGEDSGLDTNTEAQDNTLSPAYLAIDATLELLRTPDKYGNRFIDEKRYTINQALNIAGSRTTQAVVSGKISKEQADSLFNKFSEVFPDRNVSGSKHIVSPEQMAAIDRLDRLGGRNFNEICLEVTGHPPSECVFPDQSY